MVGPLSLSREQCHGVFMDWSEKSGEDQDSDWEAGGLPEFLL